ncbi:MAG: riboflavin kinase/FMN adenylyltransferase [Saprospiraceae bacterium]
MKVFRNLKDLNLTENNVVTTGTFDGVHVGHRHVIDSLISSAKKMEGESTILTFFPHPRIVLQQNTDLKLLSELDEKIELLANTGVDNLVIVPFTKAFSRLSSLDFVREVLVGKLTTKKLVIGYDHHFGRNREGSFKHLVEYGPTYGFDVEEIPAKDVDKVNISSTKIRKALNDGQVKIAESLLGYKYFITGEVVKGKQVGQKIGFPTVNIKVKDDYKLIPLRGVYAVLVDIGGGTHKGMLNIGVRPTFEDGNDISIEVNLFDFKRDVYGENLKVTFVERVRDEKSFENSEGLILQLKKDRVNCIKLLR